MASIYKPTRIEPSTGKRLKCQHYRIAYVNEKGQRVTVKGYKDKSATEALARDLERRVERIRAGLPVARDEKLHQPLVVSIDAYIADLERRGRAKITRSEAKRILDTLAESCSWTTLAQINKDQLGTFLDALAKEGRSPCTQNAYQKILKIFLNWCVQRGWLEANPIAKFPSVQMGQAGRRRLRRAYTVEEWQKMAKAAPWPRNLIYTVACLCGYRRSELARMQKCDCDPHRLIWCPRPDITKSKRREILPMLPDCAEAIKAHWDSLEKPTSKLLPKIPRIKTVHADLADAGIERQDESGRWIDFHSFRYTFCTMLARILPIQKVMVLMRHKDIRLTANLYLDLGLTDLAMEGEWKLPALFTTTPSTTPEKDTPPKSE